MSFSLLPTNFVTRVNTTEILLFTKRLATMTEAGIPLTDSLTTLIEQTNSPTFRQVVRQILHDLENGQPLYRAFAKHPQAFDQFYINLIKISEESGSLAKNLSFIATQLAKNYNLHQKIKTALLYPALIITTTILMGGFIAFFVLPQLVNFFTAFEIELPLTTRVLLWIATISRDYGLVILLGLITLMVIGRIITRLPLVKPYWHTLILKLPFIGHFFAISQLAQFSRNLGVLIASGVPITESLTITANSLPNLRFRQDILSLNRQLAKGVGIAQTIEKQHFTEFPPLVSKMIGVGEKTGKLDEMLFYLGDFFEEEIDNTTKNLTTLLEPVLLIVIGLAVGFVALAIITPIYELTGSIRR